MVYKRGRVEGVKKYIDSLLKAQGVKPSDRTKIKKVLNYETILHTLEKFKKEKLPYNEINQQIISLLKGGAQKGGKGKYYKKNIPERILRDVEPIGKIEIPRIEPHLLYSPFRIIKDTFRKIADELVLNPYTSKETKEKSADLSKLASYKKTIDWLRERRLIGDHKAKSTKSKIKKGKKKDIEDLVTRINKEALKSAATIILLFIIGISLLGYSLFNPSITGYVILESGQNVSLGVIFGIAFIIVAFGFLYIKRILKNKK